MIEMSRTVHTAAPAKEVFEYLADFTTAQQWDPNAVRVQRTSGDGGVGTMYTVTSKFAGMTTDLDYQLTERVPNSRIRLKGEKKSITAVDTITITPEDSGTAVTYEVAFDFHGALHYAEPLLKLAVKKLLSDGAEGLSTELDKLA